MAKEIITYTSEKTKESKTLTEWAKSTGISTTTLYCRLKRGMSIDEAIDASVNPVGTPYEAITDPVSGETHSLTEWAKITGMSYHTLHTRIHVNKWPIEKVLHGKRFETVTRKPRPRSSYKHLDLTGMTFGHLTVIRRASTDYVCMCNGKPKYEWKWLCECDCEEHNRVEVIQHNLLNGHCTSCGCRNTNNLIDMTGMTFGHLTVIKRAPDKIISGEKVVHWYCKCDCGNPELAIVSGHNLRNGHTISCGCRIGGVTHGKSNTNIYKVYGDMFQRCKNPNCDRYKDYGGRGIFICDEWDGYGDGFVNFYEWSMANGYSDDLTIDRIDNNGPYAPWNCRWTTMEEQSNNRRNNVLITCDGETLTASQWAKKLGVRPETLLARHKRGWSDEDIIKIPINFYIKIVTCSSGESHTLEEWSDITGISSNILYDRIFRLNWPVDTALTCGAMNQRIYTHIGYGFSPFQVPTVKIGGQKMFLQNLVPAVSYEDILGNSYTQEEWDAHQAITYDD